MRLFVAFWTVALAVLMGNASAADTATEASKKEVSGKNASPAIKATDWDSVLGASEKKGTFYGRGEAVLLVRDVLNGGDEVLGYDQATASYYRLNDLETGIVPGMRLTLGYQLTKRWALEGSYLGLHSHSGRDEFGPTNGQEPLDPAISGPLNDLEVFTSAARYYYKLDGMLHSGELAARYTMDRKGWFSPTVSLGLRYLDVAEDFTWHALDSYPVVNPVEIGDIKAETANRLFGPQFGTDLTFRIKDWVTLSLKPKVGGCNPERWTFPMKSQARFAPTLHRRCPFFGNAPRSV